MNLDVGHGIAFLCKAIVLIVIRGLPYLVVSPIVKPEFIFFLLSGNGFRQTIPWCGQKVRFAILCVEFRVGIKHFCARELAIGVRLEGKLHTIITRDLKTIISKQMALVASLAVYLLSFWLSCLA